MNNSICALEQISEREFIETSGMYLEDFKVGNIIKHRPGRTISETDNTWLTLITMNKHPLHFDIEYAKKSEFTKILVNSVITFAIINGMTVQTMSAKAVANLGWDKVKLPNPVFVGDTLYAESEILSVRESRSRSHQGIVQIRTIGLNAEGKIVLVCERTFLVPKRGAGVNYKMDFNKNEYSHIK